ncbi:hypothetical protein F2Q69_00026269 [Brassica cretica]|uniref:Uncharacterized protein n=1 Tax=Brassica cretica TaxID=69181 RepID=A0A8S9RTH0_BRACR|nr:hypothetical protein F2Q69_00026269 [Brassica cretica]
MPSRKSDKEALPSLSFEAPQPSDFSKMGKQELEPLNNRIITVLSGSSAGISETQNLIRYLAILSSNADAANVLTNGPIMLVLVKVLRLSKTPAFRVQIASLIGLLIRHSTAIEDELASSGEDSMVLEMQEGKKRSIRVSAESVFFAAEGSLTSRPRPGGSIGAVLFQSRARVFFSTGGLWWVAWSLLRMGLDSPRGGLQWRHLVVSFGSPLRNLTPIGLSVLVFSLDVSCSGGVYPSVLYGLWVKRVYTVTDGGFGGGNLQEAVGTVHPRFEGAFLSGSWQPSGLPAPFPSSWSEPASLYVVALTSALASSEFIYLRFSVLCAVLEDGIRLVALVSSFDGSLYPEVRLKLFSSSLVLGFLFPPVVSGGWRGVFGGWVSTLLVVVFSGGVLWLASALHFETCVTGGVALLAPVTPPCASCRYISSVAG